MEPSSPRRAQTRQKIIDAFWDVYTHTPYSQITVRYITSTAGCNHSTFYEYFENIDDLFEQAQDQFVDEISGYFESYFNNIGNKNNQTLYELAANTYGESSAKWNALFGPTGNFLAKFDENLQPAIISLFGLDPDNTLDCFAADMISSSWITNLIIWYQQGMPISDQDLATLLIGWNTEGIIPTMQALSSSEESGTEDEPDAPTDTDETN